MSSSTASFEEPVTDPNAFFKRIINVLNSYILSNRTDILSNAAGRRSDVARVAKAVYQYFGVPYPEITIDAVLDEQNLRREMKPLNGQSALEILPYPERAVGPHKEPSAYEAHGRFKKVVSIIEGILDPKRMMTGWILHVPLIGKVHFRSTGNSSLKDLIEPILKHKASVIEHLKKNKNHTYLLVCALDENSALSKINSEDVTMLLKQLNDCIKHFMMSVSGPFFIKEISCHALLSTSAEEAMADKNVWSHPVFAVDILSSPKKIHKHIKNRTFNSQIAPSIAGLQFWNLEGPDGSISKEPVYKSFSKGKLFDKPSIAVAEEKPAPSDDSKTLKPQ